MRSILIGFILLLSTQAYSQKKAVQITVSEQVIGKDLRTNKDIKAIAHKFPDRIQDVYMDTVTGYITVQLRALSKNGKWLENKGDVVVYDLKKRQVKWTKNISYQLSSLQQYNQTMIHSLANASVSLDINSGKQLWNARNTIYFVDPFEKVGIGYKVKSTSGLSHDLQGINLENGKILWERKLSRDYGWNDVHYLSDTTLLLVSDGLHRLNLRSGKGWDYTTVTGKKDYTGTVVANAAGIAVGLLTGTFVTTSGHDVVRDVASNVLIDSTSLYFASKDQLARIDKTTGVVKWTFPFPKDVASKSSIFMHDDRVYMVNTGYAFMGYRLLNFGAPFIAAFDKQSGEKLFFTMMNEKEDPILRFRVFEDELYLVFKHRIAKYQLETGALIAQKELPETEYGELKYFISDQAYLTNADGTYYNLLQTDTTHAFVFTSTGITLAIDKQLNVGKAIDFKDLHINYLDTGNYKFISKENKSWIINGQGMTVAELDVTSNAFLIGTILYEQKGDTFFAIDLTQVLSE